MQKSPPTPSATSWSSRHTSPLRGGAWLGAGESTTGSEGDTGTHPALRTPDKDWGQSKVDELSRGNRIEFREFVIIELKRRKPRTARNPKTGDSVQVPEKTVVSFTTANDPETPASAPQRR